jgi:hypothetical protein
MKERIKSMAETILIGRGRKITESPRAVWEGHLSEIPKHADERLGFMSEDHHRVRYFAVEELPRVGKPLEPEYISQKLDLTVKQVISILEDLEKHLTFLVRDEAGAVAWAYPVTVERTPHVVTFRSGERLYGA